ncbi:NDR1/HIN1-like protein 13 [Impatiens glandulifera]|uniref:NDR1/HIN1-like protein 13 n=1 Tax=Impatiens glandulifera TaxID=253017 RepID=UPI001FB173F6|nr:NDR1/HIN1-like protein 13 [Impatiens glandulifera]
MDHHHDSSSQPPPPVNSLDTYILQIPRDQIYRVPPPENAEIIRSIPIAPKKKKKKQCDPLCCFFSLCAAMIIFFIATVLLVLYLLLHLKTPEFSITGLTYMSNSSSTSKHANPSYDVTMKVHNPNKKMHIFYENGGNVSLLFEKDKLGGGKYPLISQEPNESKTIKAVLSGSAKPLPAVIQKRMNATGKASGPITLSLVISEPIELKGAITTKKRMAVMCEFGVNTLSSSTKILSQECHTEFFFEKQKS